MAYTRNQGVMAEWIVNRKNRDRFRRIFESDAQLKCYVLTGQASSLYFILKENTQPYVSHYHAGVFDVQGTGRQKRQTRHSGQCGMIFETGFDVVDQD